jgi:aldose 1-epimerase
MDDRSRGEGADAALSGSGLLERAFVEDGSGAGARGTPGDVPARTPDPADPEPPTGRQFGLRRGGVRAVVTEVGANLRELRVGSLEVLRGFPADGMPEASRGQVLIPFPNRVDRGRYAFHGRSLELPLDEPERTNAMHGLVRWLNWAPLSHTPSRLVMGLVLHARNGYPFVLSLRVAYTLTRSGLRVRQSVRNLGGEPAPYGAGFHPYLSVGTPAIDECLLTLPATTYFLVNARLIPTGRAAVSGTPLDFREPRAIGDTMMDTGFTELARDPDGFASVELAAPGGSPTVSLRMDRAYQVVQLFTGDGLPAPERRRALAVEPYTCAPNAFNNGIGLQVLEPGGCFSSVWEIAAAP